jgi:hypothetical protein
MPSLTVRRDSGYADSIRAYKLLLDGTEIGRIASGESKSFEVTPGEHTLQAKIDWCSTKPVSFTTEDEETAFEVFSKLRGFRIFGAIIAIFNPRGYIGIKKLRPESPNRPQLKTDGVDPNA